MLSNKNLIMVDFNHLSLFFDSKTDMPKCLAEKYPMYILMNINAD